MRRKFKLTIYVLLTAAIMAVIFYFSSQDAERSKAVSSGLAQRLIELFSSALPAVGRFLKNGENIRTVAHFSEYMCLGISSMLMFGEVFYTEAGRMRLSVSASAVLCAVYALSDEIHQIFVPGRAFQLIDLAVDLAGFAIGIAIPTLIIKLTGAFSNEQ